MQTPSNNSLQNNSFNLKEDGNDNSHSTLFRNKIDNMYSILIKNESKLNELYTSEEAKTNMANLLNTIQEKHHKNSNEKSIGKYNASIFENIDGYEFSMLDESSNHNHNRNSILIKQSIDNDIVNIIKNSEERTWDTLDILKKKIEDQSSEISDLKNIFINNANGNEDSTNNEIKESSQNLRAKFGNLISTTISLNDSNEEFATNHQQLIEVPTADISVESENNWIPVINRKKKTKNLHYSKKYIFTKSIYLSNINTNITTEMVSNRIISLGIEKNQFHVTRLVKKSIDIKSLSFISFKISTTTDQFNTLMNENNWPNDVILEEFIPREKKHTANIHIEEQQQSNLNN